MKFLVDRMLGKLAKKLRMLGYDAATFQGESVDHLFSLARREGRVILTGNACLTPRRPEDRLIALKENRPSLQLRELLQKGDLRVSDEKRFSRCLVCNRAIDPISRDEAEGKVPDFIFFHEKEFCRCPQCDRIYWQGSHVKNMKKKLKAVREIIDQSQAPDDK